MLRQGPQDIPASGALLIVTSLVNFALGVGINQRVQQPGPAIIVAALEIAVPFLLTWALLYGFSHTTRLLQTLTALMGCGAVIGLIIIPLLVLFGSLPVSLQLMIFLWNLLVIGHILRHALEMHLLGGFFIAIGYAFFLYQLIFFIDGLATVPTPS